MKLSKRLARAARRGKKPKQRAVSTPFIDLTIPSAGVPAFANGYRYTWGLIKAAGRHPWRSVPLTLSTAFVFTVIKMSLIYVVGLALWGPSAPVGAEQRYVNAGLWEIFSWAMAPVVLTPWLAASVIASNGLAVKWRLVKEPLAEKGRLLQLVLLGLVALVAAGFAGAGLRPAVDAIGVGPTIGAALVLYGFFQPTLMAAVAGVWQDGLSAPRALAQAVRGWVTLWKPLLGSVLCLLASVIAVALVVIVGIALPLGAVGLPPGLIMAVGVLLLPVWLLLWAIWNQVVGGLALAYYDWGQRPASPPTL